MLSRPSSPPPQPNTPQINERSPTTSRSVSPTDTAQRPATGQPSDPRPQDPAARRARLGAPATRDPEGAARWPGGPPPRPDNPRPIGPRPDKHSSAAQHPTASDPARRSAVTGLASSRPSGPAARNPEGTPQQSDDHAPYSPAARNPTKATQRPGAPQPPTARQLAVQQKRPSGLAPRSSANAAQRPGYPRPQRPATRDSAARAPAT